MFTALGSKLSNTVRITIRAIGAAISRTPWMASAAILAFFLII